MSVLAAALAELRSRCPVRPRLGLVLGSGLGAFAEEIEHPVRVPFAQLPGFPVSTVSGHAGQFVFGEMHGVPLAVAQGRVHYYEGYPMDQVVLPVRLLGRLGVETLVLTNAAGALDPKLRPGDFVAISDHIAAFVPSPLRGANDESLGPRFPDMSRVYDPALVQLLLDCGRAAGARVRPGVYVQTPGPAYETPAEVRLYRMAGGDCVGMSTAVEAVAARHMGLRVAGLGCITNPAAGLGQAPLSHEEVKDATARSARQFAALLSAFIQHLGEGAGA